jgi:hypothetical protein
MVASGSCHWISKDTSRWNGGANFYAYCYGDGVNLIDMSGRTPTGAAVGAGVGGVVGGVIGAGSGFVIGLPTGPGEAITIPAGTIAGIGAGGIIGAAIGDAISNFFERAKTEICDTSPYRVPEPPNQCEAEYSAALAACDARFPTPSPGRFACYSAATDAFLRCQGAQ